ncbi:heat-inducible transcriptional repressor HrcA [Clostridium sediminicola]|uniref:heat-inducible transcriptional repressor HrcA n=1 Tax=Clostridium sediminicola TaxID=3114879 RepID=UPI0031F22B86
MSYDMTDRKIKILEAIIKDYITSGEPVGSRTLAKKYNLGISSATIRNEMSDLEELGYIEQLHTSSGRKPSDKGYRLYVDQMMQLQNLTAEEELKIKAKLLDEAIYEVNKVLKGATLLLSELTKLTCVLKTPSVRNSYIKAVKLVPIDNHNILGIIVTENGMITNNMIRVDKKIQTENLDKLSFVLNKRLRNLTMDDINLRVINDLKKDLYGYEDIFDAIITTLYDALSKEDNSEIYFEGAKNIFNYSEYNDVEKAKQFLSLIDDKAMMMQLLNSANEIEGTGILKTEEPKVIVKIGAENIAEDAKDCSILTAVYSVDDKPLGTIGLIGPTRIKYSKVVAVMGEFIKLLNENISNIYYDDR